VDVFKLWFALVVRGEHLKPAADVARETNAR
jgi:hypothetical protein